ncbi:MAG: amidohydrolase [Defluviitaleaceae bacterium]|nr:amidohydrolase [Defluviitaleaceae bacterium]
MLLIKNGKVFTMEGPAQDGCDILIKDGKIVQIGGGLSADGANVIDASGKFVFPGLIDAHTHLGLSGASVRWEGNDHNETSDAITPHMRSIDGINAFDETFADTIQMGVTCVATSPGSANVIGGQITAMKTGGSYITDELVIKAPIAIKCALGENPKNAHGQSKKNAPITRMATAALFRETFIKAKEYMVKMEKNADDKKPEYNMKYEALIPVIKKEIPIHIHAHQANDILTAIRLKNELDIRMVIIHASDGHLVADAIKQSGCPTIIGPTLTHKSKPEVKNKTWETVNILNQAGILTCITTDHPVIPLQHLNLCAALAVQAGMDRMEALKCITIYAAQVMCLDDRVGSLVVGKDGDVSIWDGCPLDATGHVTHTIIEGKVVYQR